MKNIDRIETPSGTKMDIDIEVKRVKECLATYKNFDSKKEPLKYVSVVQWSNGEGWDVSFDDVIFHMHFNQWDALKKAMEEIEKDDNFGDTSGGIDLDNFNNVKKEDFADEKKDDLPF